MERSGMRNLLQVNYFPFLCRKFILPLMLENGHRVWAIKYLRGLLIFENELFENIFDFSLYFSGGIHYRMPNRPYLSISFGQ